MLIKKFLIHVIKLNITSVEVNICKFISRLEWDFLYFSVRIFWVLIQTSCINSIVAIFKILHTKSDPTRDFLKKIQICTVNSCYNKLQIIILYKTKY